MQNNSKKLPSSFSISFILSKEIDKDHLFWRNTLQETIGNYINSFIFSKNFTSLQKLLLFGHIFVESSPMKSNSWKNFLCLMVYSKKIAVNKISKVSYHGPSKPINLALQNLCSNSQLQYHWKKSKDLTEHTTLLRAIWDKIPSFIRGLVYLVRYLLNRFSLRSKLESITFFRKNSIFFFSYFINLDTDLSKLGKFYSNQWGDLPQTLRNLGYNLNWIHLFLISSLVPNAKVGKDLITKFDSNEDFNGHHALLDQFLDWKIVLKVVRDWLALIWSYFTMTDHSTLRSHDQNLSWVWPVLQKDWEDSWIGASAVQNLIWIHLFDKALSQLPPQKLGFYLMENQGWERLFLHSWKKHGHGTIIGVPHTTIRFWDLRYFDSLMVNSIPELPLPDYIAVNGPHAQQILVDSGCLSERCVPVEALRYQYLLRMGLTNSTRKMCSNKRILVLGDIQLKTTDSMLLDIEKAFRNFECKTEVWVKAHPGNPINLDLYPKLFGSEKFEVLESLLPHVDVVITTTFSSAAIDAFCSGLPLINYNDPTELNLSPLLGHSNARFASTPEEIKALLQDEEWLSNPSAAKPSDFFWLDEDLPRWRQLIESSLNVQ